MASDLLRFSLLLVSCWRARTPGRKCPSLGVEEVVLFRFNKMLNWQKQTFFLVRGWHHKGLMLRAPKWLAAALKRTNISTIPLVFSHQWREPTSPVFLYCIQEWDPTRVGYREPVPIWNRFQY